MARAGEELVNPISGQRILFRKTAAETGGELLEVESSYRAGGREPPPHYHPHQDEHFEVLDGTIAARIDGEERRLRPGETLDVPAGTVHSIWNGRDGEARLLWQVRPARKTEAFFETLWGLARDGKLNEKGVPNALQAAAMMREFDGEVRLAKPPRPVQRVVFGLLAPIARLRGYRGRYPG